MILQGLRLNLLPFLWIHRGDPLVDEGIELGEGDIAEDHPGSHQWIDGEITIKAGIPPTQEVGRGRHYGRTSSYSCRFPTRGSLPWH